MQDISIKEEIKTISLLWYLSFPYAGFSVFQYLEVQVYSAKNKVSHENLKLNTIGPLWNIIVILISYVFDFGKF